MAKAAVPTQASVYKPTKRISQADLKKLVASTNKEFGENVIVLGSEVKIGVERRTSGSLGIDLALGGGWPMNKWIELLGHESNGKTSLLYKTIAANQALDPEHTTLWVASEDFDHAWAMQLGIDLSRVFLLETNMMEHALQVVVNWLGARAMDCVVIDSYPALIPSEEALKEMEESTVSAGARILNKFMRKSGAAMKRSLVEEDRPCLCFLVNQWRDKVGGFSPNGSVPKTSPGGKGKNFAAHVRAEVSRGDDLKDGVIPVGHAIKFKTIKNKTAPRGRVAEVDFYFDDFGTFKAGDFDYIKETINIACLYGVIEQKGSWFYFGDTKWQGANAIRDQLVFDIGLRQQIADAVRDFAIITGPGDSDDESEDVAPEDEVDDDDGLEEDADG